MTAGVDALPPEVKAVILQTVQSFSNFTEDNDPYGEHDCAVFEAEGHKVMFKIDYYDKEIKYGSEDPADPEETTRIMTVMFVSEY